MSDESADQDLTQAGAEEAKDGRAAEQLRAYAHPSRQGQPGRQAGRSLCGG